MTAKPIVLTADRFTSQTKTPWGGELITRLFKKGILPDRIGQKVGESWEFSCDPEFPSMCENGLSLPDVIRDSKLAVFSREAVTRGRDEIEILVKLLDAADVLSVQVHPRDDDLDLKPGECGKPESWYVLAAEPGAGLYLGFSRALTKEKLREAFLAGGPEAKALMQFTPVRPGDYFEIEPGVPHAIGGGVTLLEPQRILPGKSGKTYRFWDWGRVYHPDGRLGGTGEAGTKARELHLEAGLKLVSPDKQVGPEFVNSLRRSPVISQLAGGATVSEFPANPWYRLTDIDLKETGAQCTLSMTGYGALVVLSGTVELQGAFGSTSVTGCRTVLLPHDCLPVTTVAAEASARCILVSPAWAATSIKR